MLSIALVLLFAFAGIELIAYRQAQRHAADDLLQSAERMRNMLMATRRVYHHQFLDSGIPLTKRTLGFLPAHALTRISEDFRNWDHSGLSFNNVSDIPRNPGQAADAVEMAAIEHFRANPEQVLRFVPFTGGDGEPYYHYARPIWVEAYCLKCHGERERAPPTIQELYDTAFGYQEGDLRGITSIKLPAAHVQARAWGTFIDGLILHLAAFMALFGVVAIIVRRYVAQPMGRLRHALNAMSEGEYRQRVEGLSGEFARFGEAFHRMAHEVDRREQALQRSEERFRSITQATPDAIVSTDSFGDIVTWNEGARAIFGYTEKEALGASVEMLLPERLRRRHHDSMARISAGGESRLVGSLFDAHGQRKDGEEFPVEIALSTWTSDGERYYGAVLRDLSLRRAIEDELRHAKEAAEGANRAKSEFLATMSHEIRTPMNAIIGTTDLMAETALDAEQRGYLAMARRAGNTLLELIDDILDLSRIEAGQLELERTPFAPRELVEGVVEMLAPGAHGKGLALRVEIDPGLPEGVAGDPRRLRQVLLNLVANAVKFTERGEVVVVVEPESEAAGEWVRFTVRDSGIGIDPEQHERILNAFTQADSSYTRRYGGTGLGLTIASRLVEGMGGELALESRLGEGTRVSFALPLETASVPDRPASASPAPIGDGARGLRVLLAEDSADNAELIRAYLRNTPHHLDVVENGLRAVEMACSGDYQLILMDMQMPEMDGYTATAEIRAWETINQRPRTPILALTAYALNGDTEKSLAAGCDDHLTKPIKKSRLLAEIARISAALP